MAHDFDETEDHRQAPHADAYEAEAKDGLKAFFDANATSVFFSKQLEVQNENAWYHWITNRALLRLIQEGGLRSELRPLRTNGTIRLVWNKTYRYPKRSAQQVVDLVEEYSDPNIGGALGLQGEALILEAFARLQFVMHGRDVRTHRGKTWPASDHDLDFIFERDGEGYGIEVKNTLRYIDYKEFRLKINLCKWLGIRPVFAVRMMPRAWIHELNEAGGFALILRHQLYPWTHRDLARRVRKELGLPVDAPRSLEDGTMARFLRWHERA